MKFAFKKQGIEIIPNVAFWKDLPFLVKEYEIFLQPNHYSGAMLIGDGVKAIVEKVKGRGGYSDLETKA